MCKRRWCRFVIGRGKGGGSGRRAAVAVVARARQALTCLSRRWKASLRPIKSGSAFSSTRARLAWGRRERVPLMVATTSATRPRGGVEDVHQMVDDMLVESFEASLLRLDVISYSYLVLLYARLRAA
eukprot:scaffold4649_cov55-Phaeocystis_antarctica.AAC.7